MKILFLTKIESAIDRLTPFYDFIPYQFGPFSYVLRKDINIADRGLWNCENIEFSDQILNELLRILDQYGSFSQDKLMSYVYNSYPYFAIRSKVKEQYLEHGTRLPTLRSTQTPLNTIHYEDRSIDNFLNKLINKKIDVLIDVRRDPVSMKYGFRKGSLMRYAESHSFQYLHLPQLGVKKQQRDELVDLNDYEKLFAEYELTTLNHEEAALQTIEQIIQAGKNIALLCFEKEPCCCHRTRIANRLSNRLGLPICHL